MPYEIARRGSQFCVMKQGTSETVACHPTMEKARKHMAALYANVPDASTKAVPVKATVLDDDRFRLLAIPFGGPIPRAGTPRGVDLDGEWFSERTDIKADWLPFRPVDWHHGGDAKMGRTVIGKADHLVMDEEGWWVDVWLKHGEKRLDLIRRLAEQAAQTGKAAIFGSSESVSGFVRKAASGEILVWPYWRQTLSTSPQNTLSVIRPLKATFDDLVSEGASPGAAFWSDIEVAMRDLGADLRATSRGELGAKAGRVLRADNEKDVQAALAALEEAMARMSAVLGRQPDYSPKEAT